MERLKKREDITEKETERLKNREDITEKETERLKNREVETERMNRRGLKTEETKPEICETGDLI